MNDKLKKLYDERAKIDADQRAILDTAEKEKRGLTAEDETNYENMDKRFQALTTEIKAEEDAVNKMTNRKKAHEERAEMFKERANEPVERPIPQAQKKEGRGTPGVAEYRTNPEYRQLFGDFLNGNINAKEFRTSLSDVEVRRTLQADKDVVGGFLVVPESFMTDLIQDLKDAVWIRGLARTIPMPKAETIVWPILADTVDDSDWTAELRTGTEDDKMDFEKLSLLPKPSAKRIKLSETLIRKSAIDVEALVRTELAYKFGITEEKAFLTGSGAGQPLGLFTASGNGISTARDVSTGNTTTEIKADNLINAMYNLKGQYLRSPACRWIFHRDAIKMIRKLKTGDGQYIWEPGIGTDRPATILGIPYLLSEYAPNTFTTGLRVGCIGDLSYYGIAENSTLRIQVLLEKYALENCNGYIVQRFVDGMPLLENAFSMVTLA